MFERKFMETIEEYERRRLQEIREAENAVRYTGIKCLRCVSEMINTDDIILTSNPPQKNIVCPNCGYATTVLV